MVSVTPYYGRGLMVNPGARPDQGRLTLRAYLGPAPRQAVDVTRWIARRLPPAPAVEAVDVSLHSQDGRPIPVQADGDVIDK